MKTITLILLISMLVVNCNEKNDIKQQKDQKNVSIITPIKIHTAQKNTTAINTEEIEYFKTKILKPIINKTLGSRTSYKKINTETKKRLKDVQLNYKKGLSSVYAEVHSNQDLKIAKQRAFFSSNKIGEGVFIIINVWKLYREWKSLNNIEIFKNLVIVSMFHEIVHLDKENIVNQREKINFDEFIDEEVRTWSIMFNVCFSEINTNDITEDMFYSYVEYTERSDVEFREFIKKKYIKKKNEF